MPSNDLNDFEINNGVLIKYHGADASATIPENVTEIGSRAFYMNSSVEEIILPNSVTRIDENGFQCCYKLVRIKLSTNLTFLGKGAFNNCPSLQSITLPKGVPEIPDTCFFACSKLERVVIPDGVEKIGREAFGTCDLKEVIIPEGVKEICSSAFSRCRNLSKVSLPKSIETIDEYAFGWCKYLPTSTLVIPEGAHVSDKAFDGCCLNGYRTAKCRIHCDDKCFEFLYEDEIEIKDNESLIDTIDSDYFYDEFEDIIDEAIAQYDLPASGVFNVYILIDEIIEAAKEYVSKEAKSVIVYFDELDTCGQIIESSTVNLTSLLDNMIDRRCGDEGGICIAGNYIEHSLNDFSESAHWQFALLDSNNCILPTAEWPFPEKEDDNYIWKKDNKVLEPIMWFGLPNQNPLNVWTAEAFGASNKSLWFEEDDWYRLTKIIGEDDDCFLTWYFPECGNYIPDIEDIKNTCPVHWDEEDTDESLKNKISTHMVDIMNQAINSEV